ncbi:MtrAB system histidine kinase MtrB [Cutibacterium modestum]|uniref:MtrAB system histidine kinase MtrB n=1 Tax=Cutibacterium modestum TaxID=2559073 RepID=UPI001ABE217A|nr:MtrAB system histidine kinase MtrB [Cutibacterium modestum]
MTLSSSLVILVVGGFFLVRQATAGIVEAKCTSAIAETTVTINRIQGQLRHTDLRTAAFYERLNRLADDAASQSGQYHAFIQGPVSGFISQGVSPNSVPTDLTAKVGESNGTWSSPTTVHYTDHVRPDVPGIVVGSMLWPPGASQTVPVYFIFPETQEVATIALLRRSVISVGALMALAIAVTTYLATRHISQPIRQASITASKLAGGALDERMVVRGTDDLATLASSMNDMAAQLDRRIGELERLSSLQQQFVSDVSHELRTPMTTMRMASEMIEADPEDPMQVRSVELMRAQMERFELLLADLLEISRFDAGATQLTLEDCDIVELARAEIMDVTPVADRLGTPIALVAEAAQTAEVDPRRISRIIRNLLSNAVEHADGTTVEVTVVSNDCAVGVGVRDHGVGFEPWQAEKVFGRFWRGAPSRVRTLGGSGLGLAISRQDANLHHGWLTAWGRPGQGAFFRLVVPRQPGGIIVESPLPASPTDADYSDDEEK